MTHVRFSGGGEGGEFSSGGGASAVLRLFLGGGGSEFVDLGEIGWSENLSSRKNVNNHSIDSYGPER